MRWLLHDPQATELYWRTLVIDVVADCIIAKFLPFGLFRRMLPDTPLHDFSGWIEALGFILPYYSKVPDLGDGCTMYVFYE